MAHNIYPITTSAEKWHGVADPRDDLQYASWTFPADVTPNLFEVFISDDGKYYWDLECSTSYEGEESVGPFDNFQAALSDMQDCYKASYKFD